MAALAEAMDLFEEGDYVEAQVRLVQLAERYPRSKSVLLPLFEVSGELEDWPSIARYGEQLLPLEHGHDRAETLNNLVLAYTQLTYPALAWQTAQELASRHSDFSEADKISAFAHLTEELLREQAAELLGTADLAPDEQMAILVQHDRIRFYAESGQVEKSIAIAESVLAKMPDLIPVLNHLSLSHFTAGNTDQAIAAAERVLTLAPDNFHALASLTRYNFLTAQFEAARQYAARLKRLRGDNPDLEMKQAEALAFLGDDEGIRDAYERAKERLDKLSPILLHLAAAAHHRLGKEKSAWRLWRKAARQNASLSLAQANLDDYKLPVGERDAPWYWPAHYWFPAGFRDSLNQLVGNSVRTKSNKAIETAVRDLLSKYPFLSRLFPHILDRGDQAARELVVNFIRLAETPELVRILYDFAQGRRGADALRLDAIQFINQYHSELLPESRVVPMWLQGQQREIALIGFEIHGEPKSPDDVADDILDMHEKAYDLLMSGKAARAERLLKQIIAAAPDFPTAYNQLAFAYEMQGRQGEARATIEETYVRFPDYLFARVGLSRFYAREQRIEEARDLLTPLLHRNRLHVSEFRVLVQAQMEITLADGKKEAALAWLDLWAEIEKDHPDLLIWRKRIEGTGNLIRNLQKVTGRFGRLRRR